jgi:hypothetical protein
VAVGVAFLKRMKDLDKNDLKLWKEDEKKVFYKEKKMKKRNYWFYGLSNWFKDRFLCTTEMVRARNVKGQYVGDDKSTPDVNEAYVTVPRKKRTKKKKKSSATKK